MATLSLGVTAEWPPGVQGRWKEEGGAVWVPRAHAVKFPSCHMLLTSADLGYGFFHCTEIYLRNKRTLWEG